MNVEQRRQYNEVVSRMSDQQIFEESKRLNWRIDWSVVGIALDFAAIGTVAGIAIGTNQYAEARFILGEAGLIGTLTYLTKKNEEYLMRSQVVIHNFRRRGMSLNLSRFQRWGVDLVRKTYPQDFSQ